MNDNKNTNWQIPLIASIAMLLLVATTAVFLHFAYCHSEVTPPVQMASIISLAAVVITALICTSIIALTTLSQTRVSLQQDLDSDIIDRVLKKNDGSTSGNNTPEGQA